MATKAFSIASLTMAALTLQGVEPGLVGRWDGKQRSKGGLGTWIELSRGGTCHETVGAMVDALWKIEGDNLNISVPGDPAVQNAVVKVQGDVQVQTAGGQTRRLTRVGKQADRDSSLIGLWTYQHPAGGSAYEEYAADGRFLFRLPMGTVPCTWSLNGDRVLILRNQEEQSYRWRIVDDELTLDGPSGRGTYRRERPNLIPPAAKR